MKNESVNSPSRIQILLAFFAIYFIWGTTYMANHFGLEGMGPFVLSTLRYLAAGLLLALWCRYKALQLPDKASLKVYIISGIFMLVGGSGLVVYSQQYVSSGHAAVIVATEPLWFVLLDKKHWRSYFSNRFIISGLLIGFIGIVLFSYFTPQGTSLQNEGSYIIGTLIVILSAVLWVTGTLYGKSRSKVGSSTFVITTVQLLSAGLVCGIIALFNGEWQVFNPGNVPVKAWGGLVFLITMGSLVAYLSFNWLVRVQPPAIVSTHTYVNPVVALFIGWLLASEEVALPQILALVLVLTGVLLIQVKQKPLLTSA